MVIAVLWIILGLVSRARFRIEDCATEGGWPLMFHLLATLVAVLLVNVSHGPAGTDRAAALGLSRLVGLAALVIMASACAPYFSMRESCSG